MSRPAYCEIKPALSPHELAPWADTLVLCALDAGGSHGWGSGFGLSGEVRSLLVAEPEIGFSGGRDALVAALAWLDPGRSKRSPDCAGLIGYLAYELGNEIEPLWPAGRAPVGRAATSGCPDDLPSVWLAGFRAAYRFDPVRRHGFVVGEDVVAMRRLADRVREWSSRAERAASDRLLERASTKTVTSEAFDRTHDGYRAGVRAILEWIRAGDVYQVNLARRVELAALPKGAARSLHRMLCQRHPAPFAALLETGHADVVSNSPERFLRVVGRQVETCPIKGTRPRGRTAEDDQRLARSLIDSDKDQAEHLMIVDLERNDLGRVCEIGSIRVCGLAELRSFPTVHHLVSTVRGRLRPEVQVEALLAATFPGGSITGAPKLRARQIIDQLETVPRSVYTGAIGTIDAAGGVDLSIAIRTAMVSPSHTQLYVGGGIVADSDPEEELMETATKARAFSMLWDGSW